jgi:hypothetical protein
MKKSTLTVLIIAAFAATLFAATPQVQQSEIAVQQVNQQPIVKKPVEIILPRITEITPFYDDCQLLFALKGKFLGQAQGTRAIRMKSATKTYYPQITSWTATRIDCRLTGDFELGRTYKVYVWDNATNKVITNQYDWTVMTELKLTHQGYTPGQVIAVSGCLLGTAQGMRRLIICNTAAAVSQWTCEDIVFAVPNLLPKTYPLYLMDGRRIISNKITIQIN